jgi:CheY-like chemotaxis protein
LAPLTPPSIPALADLDGRTVLVVDDDFTNIFALTALLERSSLEVVSAENGETALAMLEQTPVIDLVIVDIVMPGMDGYQTLRAMRELLGERGTPLIAVTAKIEQGERERCLDAGASDYAPKPVNTADLIAILGKWIPAGADTAAGPSF